MFAAGGASDRCGYPDILRFSQLFLIVVSPFFSFFFLLPS